MYEEMLHSLGLIACVDITTEDNRYYLQVCVKSLENWFETTLERADFITEVRIIEEGF